VERTWGGAEWSPWVMLKTVKKTSTPWMTCETQQTLLSCPSLLPAPLLSQGSKKAGSTVRCHQGSGLGGVWAQVGAHLALGRVANSPHSSDHRQ
jgi:hypothetical protein